MFRLLPCLNNRRIFSIDSVLAQVWDDRIGSARVQARSWRLPSVRSALLRPAHCRDHLARRTRIDHPWVVQVDRLGEAQVVAPADVGYMPSDPQVAFHLARFIEYIWAVPDDPIIVRQNWLRAYDFVTDKGALALNDYARTNDPFALIGREQGADRRDQRPSAPRQPASASPGSSGATATAALPRTSCWTAILTIVVQTPRTPDALRKNPLGIFGFNAINWSKELGS